MIDPTPSAFYALIPDGGTRRSPREMAAMRLLGAAGGGARLSDYIEGQNSTPTVVPLARREQSSP
jgi:hypothetical protein